MDKTILYIPNIKLTPADIAVVPSNLFSEFIFITFLYYKRLKLNNRKLFVIFLFLYQQFYKIKFVGNHFIIRNKIFYNKIKISCLLISISLNMLF